MCVHIYIFIQSNSDKIWPTPTLTPMPTTQHNISLPAYKYLRQNTIPTLSNSEVLNCMNLSPKLPHQSGKKTQIHTIFIYYLNVGGVVTVCCQHSTVYTVHIRSPPFPLNINYRNGSMFGIRSCANTYNNNIRYDHRLACLAAANAKQSQTQAVIIKQKILSQTLKWSEKVFRLQIGKIGMCNNLKSSEMCLHRCCFGSCSLFKPTCVYYVI